MTLIQSLNLVYLIFNLLIYSFVIKIAIEVNKAEQLAMGIPIDGLISEKVLEVIADPDPIKISLIINNTFFLNKNSYISFYNNHYQL